MNPGECVTVDYNIGFHTDITTSTTWSNEARVAEYRSLPLAEPGRLYAPSSPAQVWMTNLVSGDQLLKTLISPAEATIGNEVVYQIKVTAVPMNAALVITSYSIHYTKLYDRLGDIFKAGECFVALYRLFSPLSFFSFSTS